MQNCGLTVVNFKRTLSAAPDHREQVAQACQEQLDMYTTFNEQCSLIRFVTSSALIYEILPYYRTLTLHEINVNLENSR